MKKFVKLLPAALGLLTLTGCNSDDIFNDKNTLDLSGKTVVAVTDGDEVFTRAYKNEAIGGTVYSVGDKIRMYDSNLQKYDNFKFIGSEDGNYFALGEGVESNVAEKEDGTQDYAYALFGSDNVISYAGWNGAPLALLKITDKYEYEEKDDQNGVAVYKSILPTFGTVRTVESNGAFRNNGKHYGTTQYTLVGRAKVTFAYGAGTGAKRVRVTSLKFNEGKSETDFKALENEKRQETKLGEDIFAEKGAKALAGWFEAVLTDEPNATRTDFGLREIQGEAEGAVEPAKGTSITVSVAEGAMDKYTNVIFFPIAPGDYDMLLFEYSTADTGDDEWYYIGHRCGTVVRSDKIGDGDDPTDLTVSAEIEINDESLIPGKNHTLNGTTNKGLQTYLEEYAKLGKSLEITVNGSISVGAANTIENYRELTVPELSEDITLNIKGQITGEDNTLTIKGGGGKGKLTINYDAETDIEAKIVVNVANDFELKGKYAEEITVENVGNLTLNGEFTKAVTSPEGMTGNIAVSGKYEAGAVLSTTGNITVGEVEIVKDAAKKMNLTANNILIEGSVGTLETTGATILAGSGSVNHSWTHNSGDLTIEGKSSGGTVSVKSGIVTVVESGSVSTLTLVAGATSATINGRVNTLTTNGAPVDVNEVTVKILNVKAPVAGNGIVLNAGTIETLNGYTGENVAKTTVKSTGTADIKAVSDGDNFKFTSEIDGDTEAVEVAASDNTVNIYTGAQLLSLQGTPSFSATTINLNTDVEATNVDWTPSAALFNKAATFNGNEKKVCGLKIVTGTSKQSIAFFSKISNSSKVTIKEFELLELSYDGEATGVLAGLVGTVTSEVSIENVNVAGSKLYGAASVYCVGGLIARAEAGNVTIKNTTVKFDEIAGKQYVGGLIGDDYNATANIEKTITVEGGDKNIVTLAKLTSSTDATTANVATFGMLVGAVRNAGTTLSITGDKLYNNNYIAGHRSDFLYNTRTYKQDGVTFLFSGVEGNYVGYCAPYDYSSDSNNKNKETKVKVGAKTYTWNELNKFEAESNWQD